MSKLMDELMAEAQRVNALEAEVERTVETQANRVRKERVSKAQSIALFLGEMCDALIEADAMRNRHNGAFFTLTGVTHREADGYNRDLGIIFYTDRICVGNYYCGSGDCQRVQSFTSVIQYGRPKEAMSTLIDAWNEDIERRVEKDCAEHIKETLAKRMEEMQKNLQKSNDDYARYVKE